MNARIHVAVMVALALFACNGGPPILPDDAGTADGRAPTFSGVTVGRIELVRYPEVERCREAATALSERCPMAPARTTCRARVIGAYCHPDGRPELLADALDCLRENSSPDRCQTFPDPRGAAFCVQDTYDGITDARVAEINRRANALCASTATPFEAEPPLYSLAPHVLSALEACLDTETECDALRDCFDRGPLAPFLECE